MIFLFPGQGSQSVGMGQALAQAFAPARDVFEAVDAALGENLSRLMWDGPLETLTLTQNAQPAIMAVSLAVMRSLEHLGIGLADTAKYVAGHSLGEYSALTAAGAVSLEDTARLLRTRGAAMQAAVPEGVGAMAAILGLAVADADAVAQEAAEHEVCALANDNADGQVVLSGHKAAVARAIELAKAKGAKRAIPLSVSAPFHCALMAPAQDVMAKALEQVRFRAPCVPVISNVSAQPMADPDDIKAALVNQITARVRWRESLQALAAGGTTDMVELGAGKVLTGMARRIDTRISCQALGTPAELEDFVATHSN